ncbi:DUF962 domain-containing protein [Marinobacter salarius]|jgi:hypothetical protein|uniref:DUF962 domain-containing protein n=1 Tax=Marinobacter salarius TaxID=1420917 RepID=UPI0018F15853|nr:DUF962 domain-containing protein [Marinobacter salarius]MBJ7302261.1 DUF962 domain-containing protein [Marinobacter salarius]HIO29331.1 DUF962 domain-containing protein [Marinobacter salarius]
MSQQQTFRNFADFYPYYLEEHSDVNCRRLHFVGSLLVILVTLYAIVTAKFLYLLLLPIIGYGFAWVGHYGFEKNRPATFKYPLYSLMGDWVMFRDVLIGRIRF